MYHFSFPFSVVVGINGPMPPRDRTSFSLAFEIACDNNPLPLPFIPLLSLYGFLPADAGTQDIFHSAVVIDVGRGRPAFL